MMLADITLFNGYDVIHSLFAAPFCMVGYRAADKYNKKFIMGAQGTYGVQPFLNKFSRLVFKRILKRANHVVTPSEFTKKSILSFYSDAALRDKLQVIHNGVEFNRFYDDKPALKNNEVSFIGVGGLKPRKGFDVSIKSFALVVNKHKNIKYKIIGSGPKEYEEYLKKLVVSLGIESNVDFMGEIVGKELVDEMRKSYAYLHTPILQNWNFEGFGIVYLEANASAIPSIGSNSGGVPDAIQHGYNGYVAEEYDVESTAMYLMKIIEETDKYKELSENSVQWAKDHDWSKVVDQYIQIYIDKENKT